MRSGPFDDRLETGAEEAVDDDLTHRTDPVP
jgi:hypothetical protein